MRHSGNLYAFAFGSHRSIVTSVLDGQSILVTGGAGFVGSNLIRKLQLCNVSSITVVDNLLSSERLPWLDSDGITFVESSITDKDALDAITDTFDYVFHLATYHGNQSSIADPIADHDNNSLTTLALLNRICRFKRLKKVVYSSAGCTVAPKNATVATATEEDAAVSLYLDSPYQISKIIGELYGNYYWSTYGVPFVKARFQNVYGPGEILGAGKWRGTPATVWRNVVPTFVYRALCGLPIHLENGGIASRDFIFAEDIADGLIACAVQGEAGQIYNIASGVETSIADLAELIVKTSNSSSQLEVRSGRLWDHSIRRFGSTSKSQQQLGFSPKVGLETGIHHTIEWTRENMPLIEAMVAKHAERMAAAGGEVAAIHSSR
jgi:nucleoside-diphosphate-sugar epimerase